MSPDLSNYFGEHSDGQKYENKAQAVINQNGPLMVRVLDKQR